MLCLLRYLTVILLLTLFIPAVCSASMYVGGKVFHNEEQIASYERSGDFGAEKSKRVSKDNLKGKISSTLGLVGENNELRFGVASGFYDAGTSNSNDWYSRGGIYGMVENNNIKQCPTV